MSDIFERIFAERNAFFAKSGKQPNVIHINMADYRALCEWAKDKWTTAGSTRINFHGGELMTRKTPESKPDTILGMRIIKRAGEMECAFDWREYANNTKAPSPEKEKVYGIIAINPKSEITVTHSDEPQRNDCIVTWIDQYTGEQFKRTVEQEFAFMLMGKLRAQGEKNIAAILVDDDFVTMDGLTELTG